MFWNLSAFKKMLTSMKMPLFIIQSKMMLILKLMNCLAWLAPNKNWTSKHKMFIKWSFWLKTKMVPEQVKEYLSWNLVVRNHDFMFEGCSAKYESYHTDCFCDNYVPQWWVEFDDELSWLFTNKIQSFLSCLQKIAKSSQKFCYSHFLNFHLSGST